VERRPIAHRITRFSTSNLAVMQSVAHSDAVFEPGPHGDAVRRKVGHDLGEGLKKEWFSKNMHLGNRYLDSPVCIYENGEDAEKNQAEFLDAVNYRPSTRVGVRAPHVWLRDGRSTLDLFGRGFVLMCDARRAEGAQRCDAAARALGIPLQTFMMQDAALLDAYEYPYVLVRPDGHVAWRGKSVGAEASAVLMRAAGRST
jgi:hypothetical protein